MNASITKFSIGDEVWIYNNIQKPREGLIVDYGRNNDIYIVEFLDYKELPVQYGWHVSEIYKRPEQKLELISDMKDDAYKLERYAIELSGRTA